MKIGVFSVSMPDYGIEETVKILHELGYDGVEWRVGEPAPERKPYNYTYENRYWTYNKSTLDIARITEIAGDVKKICDGYGIEIYSLTTYLTPWDTDRIERVMKAAVIIGCGNIRVFTPNYDGTENYRVLFDRVAEQTKVIEKMAGDYNVKVCYEIHMRNIIPSASAAYRLVSDFDPKYIGVIFDPGNMVHEGFENYRLGIELLGDYLAYVHIKNAKWEMTGKDGHGSDIWEPRWTPLKKGYADLKKLCGDLRAAGYNGFLSVEDFSNEQETYEKLKSNLEYLRAISM